MNVDFVVLRGDDVWPRAVRPLDLPVALPFRGHAEDGVHSENLHRLRGAGAFGGARRDRHDLYR